MEEYFWTYGCTPTASSMVLGYWDNSSYYGRLVDFYYSNTCGNGSHDSLNVPNTIDQLREDMGTGWDTNTCTGDGKTPWENIKPGLQEVTNVRNGYSFSITECALGSIYDFWCWNAIVAEINANRPFVWSVAGATSAHSVPAWGYRDDAFVIIYDTWSPGGREDWYYRYYLGNENDLATYVQVEKIIPGGGSNSEVSLDEPNGGEVLNAGKPSIIWWYQWGTAISKVDIFYSLDAGVTWSGIAAFWPSAEGWNTYTWQVPDIATTDTVRVKVAAYNSNNWYISGDGSLADFTIGKFSDLIVQGIETNPTFPAPGQAVLVTATAINQGLAATGDYYIDIYADPAVPPVPGKYGYYCLLTGGLAPGATATCQATLTFNPAGTHKLWAQVDSENLVPESDNSNNIFGPQDLVVGNYTLTVTKAGTGTGTATTTPAGITCGSDCTENFNYNTSVTLMATASTGSSFIGWTGDPDCSDDGAVTMTASKTCTANFVLSKYGLNVIKTGTGSGTVTSIPAGIACGADCTEYYNYKTPVKLTPAASVGSTFGGWSGDPDCADGLVTMSAAKTCTAKFILNQYSLNVTKAGAGRGTVTSSPAGVSCGTDCTQKYDFNTSVTLTAEASTGSTFGGWSGSLDCLDGVVTISAAKTCTATFTLNQYALNVSKTGTGSGTVTSIPAGISCGADCAQNYNYNTPVALKATAAAGSSFQGFSGDPDCADGLVTMSAARTCTALFTLNKYPLYALKTGNGSGSVSSDPPGIDCGTDCEESYDYKASVTLTAAASAGSIFGGWSGTLDCLDGVVTMSAGKACTAKFTLKQYALNVTKAGTGSGTVTSIPAGIACGADCAQNYNHDTFVTLIAAASPGSTFGGSTFSGWSGDPDCSDGQVTMSEAKTCTATFTLNQYTLSVTEDRSGNGSGTVTSIPAGIDCGADCAQSYDYKTAVTLKAAASAGSTFTGWSGDPDCLDGLVTMSSSKTCAAKFTLKQYALKVTKTGTGSGTVTSDPTGVICGADCTQNYPYGTPVTLTVKVSAGSTFGGWGGDPDCSDGVVTMSAAKTCTATFTLNQYTLEVTKDGRGSGTVTSIPAGIACGDDCTQDYNFNTSVHLAAAASTGSIFGGWSGDPDCSDGVVILSANKTCTATFNLP